MSTIKSPQDKKRLSLQRDRRNMYRENDKASRKLIPLGKQFSHMGLRRSVAQILTAAKPDVGEEIRDSIELKAKVKATVAKRKSFRKLPDVPLGKVLARTGKRAAKP
jgi:hypothetical protein